MLNGLETSDQVCLFDEGVRLALRRRLERRRDIGRTSPAAPTQHENVPSGSIKCICNRPIIVAPGRPLFLFLSAVRLVEAGFSTATSCPRCSHGQGSDATQEEVARKGASEGRTGCR